MGILLWVMGAWAAVFSGPADVKVSAEDVVVAWKNTSEAAITVSAVHVDDAATLQVVPPRLPKVVEPGKSFKFLIVAEGTLVPGFVTVETSAGEAKLWVNVARAYVPVVAGGSKTPGATAGPSKGSGGMGPAGTISGGASATATGAQAAGFGAPGSTLQIRGPLDEITVDRTLKDRHDALAACGGAAVEHPVAVFTIGRDGAVGAVAVEDAAEGPCLEAVIRDTRFPAPDAPVDVRWAFVLGG